MMEEFDIPPLKTFKTYCPSCSQIKDTILLEPRLCKVCKEKLIFIKQGRLPEEYEPKFTRKGWAGLVIALVGTFGPLAPLILFYSNSTLILYLVCVIGGIVVGAYLGATMWNQQIRELIRTFVPADTATIPLIKGVRVFQLGRYLSQDIVPCPKCEMLIPGDSNFCKECGASLLREVNIGR